MTSLICIFLYILTNTAPHKRNILSLAFEPSCNPHPQAAWAELIKSECYGDLPVHSNIPVFTERLHDNLWLNGIKMTVKGLEFHSEVLQQSFPVLSVSAVHPGFDIVCVVSA